MKVGLIVESGKAGLEAVVCRRICDLLAHEENAQLEVDIVALDNKRRLLEECGTTAAALLGGGCDRVVILWDERPAWPSTNEKLCWHRDREHALGQLAAAQVPTHQTHLVCIEREFESWLMFDHDLLSRVLSRRTHPVRFPKQNKPDRNNNPKGTLTSKFSELAHETYVDVTYAPIFARHLESTSRLRRCRTFQRFVSKLLGI